MRRQEKKTPTDLQQGRRRIFPKCVVEFLDLDALDAKNAEKRQQAIDTYLSKKLRPFGVWKDFAQFCHEFPFDAEDKAYQAPANCKTIPLMDIVGKGRRQFVLGRVRTLATYGYNFCPSFVCLSLPYGADSAKRSVAASLSNTTGATNAAATSAASATSKKRKVPTWSIQLNDIFILCGTMIKSVFPIRLVLDERIDVATLARMEFTKKQKRATAFEDIGIFTARDEQYASVTWREICQLCYLHDMHLYQSEEHPHTLFFSHSPRQARKGVLRKIL